MNYIHREATTARLYEKVSQIGLMLLSLGVPIGSLAFLERMGITPSASIVLLISSSLMMLLIALLSISRPVIYIFWIYTLLMLIWVVSFDLRISRDLVEYMDGRSIVFANLGKNSPGKFGFSIYEMDPGSSIEARVVMKAEKAKNLNQRRQRAEDLTRTGHIVAENGLWLIYIKNTDFNEKNRILKRHGLGKDHIERVLNAFIFW